MYEWSVTYRCDEEDVFCTETQTYKIPVFDIVDALQHAVRDLGHSVTIIEIKRVDV